MSLSRQPTHPSGRSFVLKLHHDADPGRQLLVGRIEHIASGRTCEFGNVEELLACLARGLASAAAGGDDDEGGTPS